MFNDKAIYVSFWIASNYAYTRAVSVHFLSEPSYDSEPSGPVLIGRLPKLQGTVQAAPMGRLKVRFEVRGKQPGRIWNDANNSWRSACNSNPATNLANKSKREEV